MAQHDSQEYRFLAIEKKLDKLDLVHEIVTRLDERFDKFDTVYDNRVSSVEKVQEVHGKDLEELKTFKWKAAGIIGVIMVIVSIFGSALGNAIVKKFTSVPTTPNQARYFDEHSESTFPAKDKQDTGVSKGSSQLIQNGKDTH